ncbi:MAG: DEAD/DEAH box helicase [Verrucomicrobiales bacterium]
MPTEFPNSAHFANALAFTKPWRRYQARVLEKLPRFLKDGHFHLVAAPGSGKTVIGLEIIRQLGQPTLVLAPTLAIREQWINRLTADFLKEGESTDWLSRDLKNPATVTITTYQSLSSEFRNEGGDDLIKRLREVGISLLVVDEAHHLRAVWWKCLSTVKDAIENPVVVSLTATPPIDVPQSEWNRYAMFCGEVDEEVGVPELVAEGNLCPHQDYVLLSTPTGKDVDELKRFREGVATLILDLQLDIELAEAFGFNSPVEWISEQDDRDSLRKNQAFYLGLAIFLQKTAGYIPAKVREVFNIFGDELPDQLDTQWTEGLLQGLIFDFRERIEKTEGIAADVKPGLVELEKRMRDLGAIEKGRVVLTGTKENDKILRDSPAKLQSIAQIIEHELLAQSVLMRAVILTDHIRKDAFPTPGEVDPPLVKLGVVPIFELLRRLRLKFLLPGALTGSIIIIPAIAENHFREIACEFEIGPTKLRLKQLPHDPDFLEVEIRDADRQRAVSAVTELFQRGDQLPHWNRRFAW